MAPSFENHIVTAVLVTHEGARWLPETLKALLTQTRPAERLVAADTGSRDTGPAILAEVLGEGRVLGLPGDTGYGAAVAAALAHPTASAVVPTVPGHPSTEWIWLIHDDSAPAPNALECLLASAEANPPATILGPKLRDWDDRRLLLEAGVAIDRAGRRETGLERREFDQGQHDGIREVMAVSTAGMLVRRDVWDELGGLDQELGLFRDDVDFGWRAYAAGHRVLIATSAVFHHAEASARGRRESILPVLDRRNALFVLFANLPARVLAWSLLRNSIGSLLRVLLFLASKRPAAARDELTALGALLGDPRQLLRARAARAKGGATRPAGRATGSVGASGGGDGSAGAGGRGGSGRADTYRNIGRFQPRGQGIRRLRDALGGMLAGVAPSDAAGRHHSFESFGEDGLEEPPPFESGSGVLRRLFARPAVLMVLGLALVAVIAERSIVTSSGPLGGGALLPVSGGASDLWNQYLSGWHPVDLGSAQASPPYVAVLALVSTLLLGKVWLAVVVLLAGSVPLAGLTALVAARTIIPGRPGVAIWMAVTYALTPVLSGAIADGRIGTAVNVVLLPLIGSFAYRMCTDEQARHAAWAMAALLTVAMVFAPLAWLLAACAGSLVAYFVGADSAYMRPRVAVALIVPPLLTLPWWLGLVRHPSRFLLEAGVSPGGGRTSALSLFLLDADGRRAWMSVGLLVTALAALLLRRRRRGILLGWLLALFGLLVATGVSASSVQKWPGIALTFAAAGVIVAASGLLRPALDAAVHRDRQRGLRGIAGAVAGAVVVILAFSTPLAAAVSWMSTGVQGPLTHTGAAPLPLFMDAAGSTRPRMLVLDEASDGTVSFTVLRDRPPILGEEQITEPKAARRRITSLVTALASGQGAGVGGALSRTGVQFVVLRRPTAGPLENTLDGVPDLVALNRTNDLATWRLVQPGGRLMLVDGSTVTPLPTGTIGARVRVPAGDGGRTLLLAEPADGGWRAKLNGASLRSRTVDGWAEAYPVPASGGRFTLDRSMRSHHIWVALQGLALVIVVVLALPSPPPEESAARRRARHGHRGRRVKESV